jgi:predicted type IV restriction endonuclease
MGLHETIGRIVEAMRTGQFVNEAAISTAVVMPLLQDLDWPIFDPAIVAPEFTVENRRVDFALCHPRNRAAVFIEVKQPGKSEGADKQLFEYAFILGVPLAVLTDGREWHFYLPSGQGHYQERRVYKLDLIERGAEEGARRLRRYLAHEAVVSGAAARAAQEDYASVRKDREIAATVPQAWHKLLAEQDELLVDLLADQVESLCGYKPDPEVVTRFLAEQAERLSQTSGYTGRPPTPQPPTPTGQPAKRTTYPPHSNLVPGFTMRGTYISTRNAKDTLIRVLEHLADDDETFLQRFASLPKHGRSRRFLASDRGELYPGRPDLAIYSHELRPGWWVGTNYGAEQIRKILHMACEVAGLQLSKDAEVHL